MNEARDTAPELVIDGPAAAPLVLALAHGAGAGADTPFMAAFAEGLAAKGRRVARFEFPYMARRRLDGKKRPPDREPALLACWRAVVEQLGGPGQVVLGGKSMGGRMASLLAAELEAEGRPARGLLCLGYPFHPPGKPERLRTAHLGGLTTPGLILQGTRDPFGGAAEVAGYALSPALAVHWLADGDHDFKPRKASGRSARQNWVEAIDAMDDFLGRLG